MTVVYVQRAPTAVINSATGLSLCFIIVRDHDQTETQPSESRRSSVIVVRKVSRGKVVTHFPEDLTKTSQPQEFSGGCVKAGKLLKSCRAGVFQTRRNGGAIL